MAIQEPNLASQLPAQLYQRLKVYQQTQGHESLSAALIEALQSYFELMGMRQPEPGELPEPLDNLEKRVNNLTREMFLLRQEFPQSYDRLREQMAAIRLSHSGLLKNLRDRIEVLEQAVEVAELNEVQMD